MRDRVLAIVTLIAQLVMEEPDQLSEDDIVGELLAVGFATEEIDAAFLWMEELALADVAPPENRLKLAGNRIFSAEEKQLLSLEARGFLIRLSRMGIIDSEMHEEVVARAMQSEEEVSLKELKTIIANIFFSHAHKDWRREMECLFDDDWSRLYH